MFEESFRELHRRSPEELKSRLYVIFEGEEGQVSSRANPTPHLPSSFIKIKNAPKYLNTDSHSGKLSSGRWRSVEGMVSDNSEGDLQPSLRAFHNHPG